MGGAFAHRFQSDIGPLAASRDDSPESLAQLADIIPRGGKLILLQVEPIVTPPTVEIASTALANLMVAERVEPIRDLFETKIEPLYKKDWPEMHQLADLTKPGPFERGTPKLGEFFGIKENGALL
ncbi:MAG: GNAT family N-acetyltransferase, partial [Bdellovibrionota bacterium]